MNSLISNKKTGHFRVEKNKNDFAKIQKRTIIVLEHSDFDNSIVKKQYSTDRTEIDKTFRTRVIRRNGFLKRPFERHRNNAFSRRAAYDVAHDPRIILSSDCGNYYDL